MLEELAIGVLGYVVLDKFCKDADRILQSHKQTHERIHQQRIRKQARLASQRDLERLLTTR